MTACARHGEPWPTASIHALPLSGDWWPAGIAYEKRAGARPHDERGLGMCDPLLLTLMRAARRVGQLRGFGGGALLSAGLRTAPSPIPGLDLVRVALCELTRAPTPHRPKMMAKKISASTSFEVSDQAEIAQPRSRTERKFRAGANLSGTTRRQASHAASATIKRYSEKPTNPPFRSTSRY